MTACDRRKSQLLRSALVHTDPDRQLKALHFPYNEVLLGLLLVLSIVYCAVKCLPATHNGALFFAIGYLSAVLTSYGTYQRIRKTLNELGLPRLETPVVQLIVGFCCGMALFLVGMLMLTRHCLLA